MEEKKKRTLDDLKDIQRKSKQMNQYLLWGSLFYFLVSLLLLYFTKPPNSIPGVILVLIIIFGLFSAPLVWLIFIQNREIIDTLYGYHIPLGLSLSETILLCFSDLHFNINEYGKRIDKQNRKKIAKQIHYISSKLIDKINDPLHVNMSTKYYNKKLDLFSEDLFKFINDTTRILEGIEDKISKQEDFNYNDINIDFGSIIKELKDKGDKIDFQFMNPFIGSLLNALGLPQNIGENDDVPVFKRVVNYPFIKTIMVAIIYLIIYLTTLSFIKPEITMDTKWLVGATIFVPIVIPFLLLDIHKYWK